MLIKKYVHIGVLVAVFGYFLPANVVAYSYNLNTSFIYNQARNQNHEYFQLLRRYPRAIDMADSNGDTAYCIALKNQDEQAAYFLATQGANVRHSCVGRLQAMRQEQQRQNVYQASNSHKVKTVNTESFFSDNTAVWTTLGVIAVGGGVALALSGGGGGSGGHNVDPGRDVPVFPPEPVDPVGPLVNVPASDFKTTEYNQGNFLSAIKAAEAYSYIYQKDANNNLFSHQANSVDALAEIKVGIIDSGVYSNNDLKKHLSRVYDLNQYNTSNSVWGAVLSNGMEAYVIKKEGLYYLVRFKVFSDGTVGIDPLTEGGLPKGVNEAQMKQYVSSWGISFSDMSLMNGGGGSNPGINLDDFLLSGEWQSSWFSFVNRLNHGTHVAGIIAADKNDSGTHGVAFENAKLYAASWDMQQDVYATVKDMVDRDVSVINNSWGSASTMFDADDAGMLLYTDTDVLSAYAYAADHKAVWVQATGNEKMHNADIYNGIPKLNLTAYGYSGPGNFEAPYVAVAALDTSKANLEAPSGKIADYSNWCGSAQNYCLAAPGTLVNSTAAMKDGVVNISGTSMAAPVVTGSIALLNGYYPWLSAQNVAYLLLETANHSGTEYSKSNIYGRGVLDLEAAITTPIGNLGLPTTASFNGLSLAQSNKLALSHTMQKQVMKAMPKTVTAFDELHRPFAYDTSNLVHTTHASNANYRNEVSRAAFVNTSKKTIQDEKAGFSFSQNEMMDKGGKAGLSSLEVTTKSDDGTTKLYYAENSRYLHADNVLKPSHNPYFNMHEAYGAENTVNLTDVSRLKLSLQTGKNGLYERDYEQDRYSFDKRAYTMSAEYSFNLTDYLELATTGGLLYEEEAMLGMNGRGGFALNDGSTYYAGVKAKLTLTPKLSLLMAYYRGYTQGQEASLLALSDLVTESYMMATEYQLNATDKVGLSLSSPLSVVKGKASFNYASGRDNYSDTIYMHKLTSSLKPAAKEYDLGLYYLGTPDEDLSLLGKFETRFNADGEKGLTDYMGILGVAKSF